MAEPGKVPIELPSREGYLQAGRYLVVPVGKEMHETGELGADKIVGLVVGSVGYMVAGKDHWAVADKHWEGGNY